MDTNVGDPTWAWIGTITWPGAATIAVITAGLVYICKKLTDEGYQFTYSTSKTRTGQATVIKFTNTSQVRFTAGGAVPQQVLSDWVAAINADQQNDGHGNGGVVSNLSFSAQQKTKALLEIKETNGVINVID